jgi:hypothetical protein
MNADKPVCLIPTRAEVENLEAGDLALDCFGKYRRVTRVHGRGNDVKGRAYVCFYTEFTPGRSEMSGSYKEGELVRTVRLTRDHTSAELDRLEREMNAARAV